MRPDPTGRFGGVYGGRYVPETLIVALDELTAAYEEAMKDPAFLVSPSPVNRPACALFRPLLNPNASLTCRRRSSTGC